MHILPCLLCEEGGVETVRGACGVVLLFGGGCWVVDLAEFLSRI